MKNLLLIVVDCARAEKTIGGVPGGDAATTRSAPLPWLDRLRERGTTWTHFCSVSSTTTPNFATMFTGLTPREHGIEEHSRHALRDVSTVAEILAARGWHTAAETTGPLIPESGVGRGFHDYRHRPRTEYLHAGFDRRVASLLRELPEPWFLCLHLWEAHAPYRNPGRFADGAFGASPYDRALAAADDGLARVLDGVDLSNTALLFCGDHGERLDADYGLAEQRGGDAHRVLDCFRRFTAAHPGPLDYDAWFTTIRDELGEVTARIYAHNVLGHGFHLTEDLIRVPLVIVDEERCAGGEARDDVRSQRDVFATLLDLAGVDETGAEVGTDDAAPSDRGTSLLIERTDDAPIYIEANGSGGKAYAARCYLRGARTRRWKYWRVEGATVPHESLWDLDADPRETRSVAAEHPKVTAELSGCTTAWTERAAAGAAAPLDTEDEAVLQETLRGLGYL